ncbi:MAG: UMP kinase [Deltaproteobacteria bacterium CG07_land_8_20_14_0_80_38_7]|nr:MAG: UMP kinase [Deltaproteobacteria bacterium CG07_land_8_20_14_0_80_38_7]
MISKPKYKKILLKLSGEALLPNNERYGISIDNARWVAEEINELCEKGISVAVVIGGGNIFRGVTAQESGINRVRADSIGMLATVINGLALLEVFEKTGIKARLLSARKIDAIADLYTTDLAKSAWQEGHVLVLVGGTGNPFFSTDTAASLRAAELGADAIFKGTKVDGVFDKDPLKNKNAEKFDKLSFDEVLKRNLKVMDSTSVSMCRDNNIPIVVFNVFERGNLLKAAFGKQIGTVIYDYKNM